MKQPVQRSWHKEIGQRRAALFAMCLTIALLTGCGEQPPSIIRPLPPDIGMSSSADSSGSQPDSGSTPSEPESDGSYTFEGTVTPDVIFYHEAKPDADKVTEGLPYMNPDYRCVPVWTTGLNNPWELYPYLQDTVKRLTLEDLTGKSRFFCDGIYALITEDGYLDDSPSAPVGDSPPQTAELYLAKTSVTLQLQEGDVIALAAIDHYPMGVIGKVVTVYPAEEEYCHVTIQAPAMDEMINREKMKQFLSENQG